LPSNPAPHKSPTNNEINTGEWWGDLKKAQIFPAKIPKMPQFLSLASFGKDGENGCEVFTPLGLGDII